MGERHDLKLQGDGGDDRLGDCGNEGDSGEGDKIDDERPDASRGEMSSGVRLRQARPYTSTSFQFLDRLLPQLHIQNMLNAVFTFGADKA